MLERLSSDFYSYIPHDFGFMRMQNFILDNEKKVKKFKKMSNKLTLITFSVGILGSFGEDFAPRVMTPKLNYPSRYL